MRSLTVIIAAALLVGLWAAVAPSLPADAADRGMPDRAAVEETPEAITPADCPVPVPSGFADRVECGILTVPEHRGAGADPARTIDLPYAIVSSSSRTPAPDPVVVGTTDGPGGSTLDALRHFLYDADWATDTRDVILLEQRGARYATPSLDCPQLDAERFIVDGTVLSGAAAAGQQRRSLNACKATLETAGVDLSAYTSRASAADLADLRAALGYEAWNLYGVSYGSRLAMTTMRDQPEGLRSVILDSPYPPNVNAYEQRPQGFADAVTHLLDACAADLHCSERYPLLDLSLRSVFNRAAADPLEVSVAGPDGSAVTVILDETTLSQTLFAGLTSASTVRVLPFVIDQLATGNTDAVKALAQDVLDERDRLAEGLHWSVDCAEEVPFNDPEVVTEATEAVPYASPLASPAAFDICALWGVPAAGDIENAAVESGIPALILRGGFDPATPASWSESAAASLATARIVEVPSMAHGVVWESGIDDCPASIARTFLAQPDTGGSSACVERMERPAFLTTADIDPTDAVFELSRDVVDSSDVLSKAVPIGLGALLAAGLLYGLILSLKPSLRMSPDIPAGAPLALIVSSAFLLAYAAALVIVLVNAEPLLLAFGLPSSVWPVLLLPWAGIAATVLLLVLMIVAWVKDDGELSHRIALSVFTAGLIGAVIWLLVHGLLLL